MFKHFRKLNFKSDNYLALRENCLIEYRKYQKDFWDLSNHEMFKVIFKTSKNTWYIYIYIHLCTSKCFVLFKNKLTRASRCF